MREDSIDLVEVHVAGVCFYGDSVLVAQRTVDRRLYPGLWECGGGQIRTSGTFESAVKRQLKEELGVFVEPLRVLGTYAIDVPDEPQKTIPGIKFVCEIVGFVNEKEPQISPEHSQWRWLSMDELDTIQEWIPGMKKDIRDAYKIYKEYDPNELSV